MTDPNNRPGGPNLIVTAKTAHKVHFLDAATLAMTATLDMPGSTHEIALCSTAAPPTPRSTATASSPRINPDRRIVVIDLALEVADARDRPRRHLRAARRDDRRRRHGLVLGRARQRGAGDRSRRRQGAQDRRRRHRPLGGGQPFDRQGVRVGQAGSRGGRRQRPPR